MDNSMVMVNIYIPMVTIMKEIGLIIKDKVKELSIGKNLITNLDSIKEPSSTTTSMDKVFSSTKITKKSQVTSKMVFILKKSKKFKIFIIMKSI
mgnify:CR=1 FL=1